MLRVYFHAGLMFAVLAATTGLNAAENEKNVSATLPSVALFKNGVTVVQQEIDIPAVGVYCWNDVPPTVHGTFFIESDLDVEIQTAQRLTTLPIDAKNPPRGVADFMGKQVTVRFHNAEQPPVQGKLLENTVSRETNSLLSGFSTSSVNRSVYPAYPDPVSSALPAETSYKLETADGRYLFLTGQQILSVETNEPVTERTENRPVMIFHVNAKEGKTAGKIRLFYLTKGVTWAPSYRVDLLNEKRLRIEQSVLIRNEWKPLQDTEISLVSGFPQIESAQILSPLYPPQTLQQFFQQILQQAQQQAYRNRYGNDYSSFTSNAMTQQAAVPYSVADTGFDTTGLSFGEGPDIHYNNIGKRTLDIGNTLSFSTGKGETDYQRVLECDLFRLVLNYYNNRDNWRNPQITDQSIADVFDVLKFPNPLPFPMTTAPATVTEKSRFLGQSQSNWVNPGQVASVKITKVMNVRVSYHERITDTDLDSNSNKLTRLNFRSYSYILRPITGTIEIINQRNEEITLHLNSCFHHVIGKPPKIDLSPTKQSLSVRDYLPNDLMELFWELPLKPGEKKTITITGTRWVHN